MATPEEQLKTIQANLAAARIAGDTQKIQALETSQASVQALVDVNQGKFPSTAEAYNANAATTTTPAPQAQATTSPYGLKETSTGFVETSSDGTVSTYNSQGILVSMTEPDGTVTKSATALPDPKPMGSGEPDPALLKNEPAAVSVTQQAVNENAQKPVSDIQQTIVPENSSKIAPGVDIPSPQQTPPTPDELMAQALAEQSPPAEQKPLSDAEISAAFAKVSDNPDVPKVTDQQAAANRAALKAEESITSIKDWRVKLSLANNAKFLYGAAGPTDILYPLKLTNGVVFPYTPTIQTAYRANYDPMDLTHSNYKLYFYRNSAVDDIQITADFTAQDPTEAAYLLAVIHFFKSATKMFYGNEQQAPAAGTPPPLVFISGYGQYQFNHHPMLISSFSYNLPNDVDYIRASTDSKLTYSGGAAETTKNAAYNPGLDFIATRLMGAKLNKGGVSSQPVFTITASGEPTYVPTKISLSFTCLPVVSRKDISTNFSLSEYATGKLTKRSNGGIW